MPQSLMEQEALEAPRVIAKQWQENEAIMTDLCKRLQQHPIPFAMTIARGSSDHASNFAKYLFETRLSLATSSAAPSVSTLYKSQLQVKNALVLGISQSGKSPDICEMMKAARDNGAITVAIVNDVNSPLADIVEYVIPMHAGKETSVAATKSYLAALSALIQFTAIYTADKALLSAMQSLPETLQAALEKDWSPILTEFKSAKSAFVLARGYGFPIAQEAALKFKEVLNIHAEAFSGAEVAHGPFAIIKKDFPLLMFTQADVALPGMLDLARRAKSIGANTLLAIPEGQLSEAELDDITPHALLLPQSLHPIFDPLMAIQAFYPKLAQLAIKCGLNPDEPPNLKKVTETR